MAKRTGGRRLELVRVYNKDRPSCITRCRAYHLFIEWKCLRLKSPWNTASSLPPMFTRLRSSIVCRLRAPRTMKIERDSEKRVGKAFLRISFVQITKAKNYIYRTMQIPVFIPEANFVSYEDKIFCYNLIIRSIIIKSFIRSSSSDLKIKSIIFRRKFSINNVNQKAKICI